MSGSSNGKDQRSGSRVRGGASVNKRKHGDLEEITGTDVESVSGSQRGTGTLPQAESLDNPKTNAASISNPRDFLRLYNEKKLICYDMKGFCNFLNFIPANFRKNLLRNELFAAMCGKNDPNMISRALNNMCLQSNEDFWADFLKETEWTVEEVKQVLEKHNAAVWGGHSVYILHAFEICLESFAKRTRNTNITTKMTMLTASEREGIKSLFDDTCSQLGATTIQYGLHPERLHVNLHGDGGNSGRAQTYQDIGRSSMGECRRNPENRRFRPGVVNEQIILSSGQDAGSCVVHSLSWGAGDGGTNFVPPSVPPVPPDPNPDYLARESHDADEVSADGVPKSRFICTYYLKRTSEQEDDPANLHVKHPYAVETYIPRADNFAEPYFIFADKSGNLLLDDDGQYVINSDLLKKVEGSTNVFVCTETGIKFQYEAPSERNNNIIQVWVALDERNVYNMNKMLQLIGPFIPRLKQKHFFSAVKFIFDMYPELLPIFKVWIRNNCPTTLKNKDIDTNCANLSQVVRNWDWTIDDPPAQPATDKDPLVRGLARPDHDPLVQGLARADLDRQTSREDTDWGGLGVLSPVNSDEDTDLTKVMNRGDSVAPREGIRHNVPSVHQGGLRKSICGAGAEQTVVPGHDHGGSESRVDQLAFNRLPGAIHPPFPRGSAASHQDVHQAGDGGEGTAITIQKFISDQSKKFTLSLYQSLNIWRRSSIGNPEIMTETIDELDSQENELKIRVGVLQKEVEDAKTTRKKISSRIDCLHIQMGETRSSIRKLKSVKIKLSREVQSIQQKKKENEGELSKQKEDLEAEFQSKKTKLDEDFEKRKKELEAEYAERNKALEKDFDSKLESKIEVAEKEYSDKLQNKTKELDENHRIRSDTLTDERNTFESERRKFEKDRESFNGEVDKLHNSCGTLLETLESIEEQQDGMEKKSLEFQRKVGEIPVMKHAEVVRYRDKLGELRIEIDKNKKMGDSLRKALDDNRKFEAAYKVKEAALKGEHEVEQKRLEETRKNLITEHDRQMRVMTTETQKRQDFVISEWERLVAFHRTEKTRIQTSLMDFARRNLTEPSIEEFMKNFKWEDPPPLRAFPDQFTDETGEADLTDASEGQVDVASGGGGHVVQAPVDAMQEDRSDEMTSEGVIDRNSIADSASEFREEVSGGLVRTGEVLVEQGADNAVGTSDDAAVAGASDASECDPGTSDDAAVAGASDASESDLDGAEGDTGASDDKGDDSD